MFKRNVGLDIFRTLSILTVIFFHLRVPVFHSFACSLAGVDAFFALSGYLIAQMLDERFGGLNDIRDLGFFTANRVVRIMPLYFTGLAFAAATALYFGTSLPPLLPFATFTQNLTQGGLARYDNFFGQSWSLTIEEWSYVIIPLALLALRRWSFERRIALITIVLFVAMLSARLLRYHADPALPFDDMFRRTVMLRLDAVIYGAAAYCWFKWHPRQVVPAACLGLALCALLGGNLRHQEEAVFTKILMPTLGPAVFALLLPALARLEIGSSALAKFFAFCSRRAYAAYLIHLQLIIFVVAAGFSPYVLGALFMTPLIFAAAHIVHVAIERPIMRWQPRRTARPQIDPAGAAAMS